MVNYCKIDCSIMNDPMGVLVDDIMILCIKFRHQSILVTSWLMYYSLFPQSPLRWKG